MRTILIDESDDQPHAIAYSDEAAADAEFRKRLLAFVTKDLDFEAGDEEYDDLAAGNYGDWPDVGPLFLVEEGDQGVWTGFISSDRCGTAGQLPLPDDDFIGNGDPTFFLTVGVPDGQTVPAIDSVAGDYTHPLYQEWLDKYED